MKLVKAASATGLFLLALGQSVFAGVEVNTDENDLMIHGYDPVSYFTVGKPVEGKAEFTQTYNEGIYRFSSKENRDAFAENPAKYAPAYGGYCAFGTKMGKKFDGDPTAWKIVENKLYLNLNKDVQKRWVTDIPTHIKEANTAWPTIKDKAAEEL